MESSDRERVNMKFCFKLGKSATETHEMLVEGYGDAAFTRKTFTNGWNDFVVVMNQSMTKKDQDALQLCAQTKTFRK
jgi:hypothetical protein